jgi:hypothetical protein
MAIPETERLNGAAVASPALGALASVAPEPVADSAIAQAVSAAYKVVEQNVEEGRRAAERLRGAGHPDRQAALDARAVAGRLMQMTRELGGAWVDLLVALVNEPDVRALLERLTPHDRARPGPPVSSPASAPSPPASLTQRVSSRKPVELTVSPLAPLASDAAPAIAGLFALDPVRAGITGVTVARRADGGLELALAVPDDQPADTYWGTLVDLTSRQPIGTVTVRVLE